jgi:hypothetical protein
VLSKYAIAFPAGELAGGACFAAIAAAPLKSRWFWMGALVAMAIAAPNLMWLARHHFMTLQMEHFIHLRDVRHGRTKGYFTDQIKFTMFGLPFAVGGLIALAAEPAVSAAERVLSWAVCAVGAGEGKGILPAAGVSGAVCGRGCGAGELGWQSGQRMCAGWCMARWSLLCWHRNGIDCLGVSADMASRLRGVELADEE